MSRLYYPKSDTAADFTADPVKTLQEYGEQVAKLVPSEVVAGYLTCVGLVDKLRESWRNPGFAAVFVLCLVLTPVYLNKVADPGKPRRNHLIVSSIAFVVWAYSVSGKLVLGDSWYDPALASLLLIVFTLISAVVPLNR